MTKTQRIEAALKGLFVDRVPVSLWKHFPEREHRGKLLAEATLAFQEEYDFDFVKMMFPGLYFVRDWGVTVKPSGKRHNAYTAASHPIRRPEDWTKLKVNDPHKGVLAEQLEALERVGSKVKGRVPFVATIYSPLTTACKLIGEVFFDHLREQPAQLHQGLEVIADTTVDFARAAAACGVDGFFFATQLADYDVMEQAEYEEFGREYDLLVLSHIDQQEQWFNILHLHGFNVMFDFLEDYPVQAINWHDRLSPLSLSQAMERTDKCLIGGINHHGTIATGTLEEIGLEVQDALAETHGRRHVLGPGCVIPMDSPAENIRAARRAVEVSTG